MTTDDELIAAFEEARQRAAFYREVDDLLIRSRRSPPSLETIDAWLHVRPRTGKITWRKPVPPPPVWRTNPGKRDWTIQPGTSAPVLWSPSVAGLRTKDDKPVRKPKGCWMIFIPNERWVRAADVIWLKARGHYPEKSISPKNGDHSDLRVSNWIAADVVRRARNAALKKHEEALRRAEIVEARSHGQRVAGFTTKQKRKARETEQEHDGINEAIRRIALR